MNNFSQFNFKGLKALVRVDFNVPLNEQFQVGDDNRMRAAMPTIQKILKDGGSVILMSHLGRPKDGPTNKYSLSHIVSHLQKLVGNDHEVFFASDCIGEPAEKASSLLDAGDVLLLENLRFHKEEEKGDAAFAEQLSKLGDVYVNDAFGTAHRAHASTAIIADYFASDKKMFGLLMEGEVSSAEKVLLQSEKPFTAIIGGAKVSDKILIIENLLEKATDIIIGGGMAYTFWKAQGKVIGNSLCEEDRLPLAAELLEKAKSKGVKIHLPMDSTIADKFAADAQTTNCESYGIPSGWMGLDVGIKARADFREVILNSKTILWNGPMGLFEDKRFAEGTNAVARAVAETTQKGAKSIIGGGDSVKALNKAKLGDKVSFMSTGGGASLEFLEGKALPGVAALTDK